MVFTRVDSRVLFAGDLDREGCHTRVDISLLGQFEPGPLDQILGRRRATVRTTTDIPYPFLHVIHDPPPLNLGRVRHLAL